MTLKLIVAFLATTVTSVTSDSTSIIPQNTQNIHYHCGIGVVDIMPRYGGVVIKSNSSFPVKVSGLLPESFELAPHKQVDIDLPSGYYTIQVVEQGGQNRVEPKALLIP